MTKQELENIKNDITLSIKERPNAMYELNKLNGNIVESIENKEYNEYFGVGY